MRTIISTVILVSLLCAPGIADAQELVSPRARQGYFIAAGVRSALSLADSDDAGSLGTAVGGDGVVRIGQMVTERLGLGISAAGGYGQSSAWTKTGGGLTLDVQLAPLRNVDFAVRGGIGLGVSAVARRNDAEATDDDPSGIFGAQYVLGVAYDWFPFRRGKYDSGGFAITTTADARLLPGDGIVDAAMLFGIEVTYWGGLERNQLDLPVDEAFAAR